MNRKKRLLVPASGGPGSVNLCRSLATVIDVELIGCDSNPYYLLLSGTTEKWLCPRRNPEEPWVEWMAELARDRQIDGVVPNTSPDGMLFVKRSSQLPVKRFLPSLAAYEFGENKWKSFNRFKDEGLPVPRTWLLNKREDVADAFDELHPGPVWIRGAGIPGKGIGVASLPARTVQQGIAWVEFWKGWGLMTASEYLPGRNLTWLGVFLKGKLIASQGRERDEYVIPHVSPSGITGAPAISHTVNRADLNEMGPRAVLATDPVFTGPAFVDFKEDAAGVPHVTEINVGRLGTTHHFYTVAGANFPELLVRLMFEESLPDWVRPFDVLPENLYWVRTLDAGPVLTTREHVEKVIRVGHD